MWVFGVSLREPQFSQEWYVHQAHENLLNKTVYPTLLLNVYAHPVHCKNTVCPTLLLNGTYIASTKVY